MSTRLGSTLAWTSYNLPSQIVSGASKSATFSYNANHQRWKQISIDTTGTTGPAGTTTTYYVGGILEKVTLPSGVIEYRHMIPAGSGSAILTRRSNSTSSTYYTTTDHLGSGDLVMDSTATVMAKESFTPFGARRGSNWQGIPTTADYNAFSNTTRRGFTGHEMLDAVNLIHMNGRVYDPVLGRFLSADPIIQTLAISQAINPFSYVMNNPLSLIDPSGYSWLSKLFSGIGNFLHKYWRPLLAIVVAFIAMPYIANLIASNIAATASASALAATGSATIAAEAGMAMAAAAAPWIGVVAGAAAGAISGAIVGGFKGALIGALSGGFLAQSGWAWSQVGNATGRAFGEIATNGVIGGGASVGMGGRFQDGFLIAAAATGALKLYEQITTKYEPTWSKGEELHPKNAAGPNWNPADPQWDNIGVANTHPDALRGFWSVVPKFEGNWLFRGLNYIPGFNSFSTLHDWFMDGLPANWTASFLNIPSMAPALAVNYVSLLSGVPSVDIALDRAVH